MFTYERLSMRSAMLHWLRMRRWGIEYEIWRLKSLYDQSLFEKKYLGKDRLMVIIELELMLGALNRAIRIAQSSVRVVQDEINSALLGRNRDEHIL